MMQQNLKQLISKNEYDSCGVHSVIAMGRVVQEFFDVYKKYEPDALACQDVLLPLLVDLKKGMTLFCPDRVSMSVSQNLL